MRVQLLALLLAACGGSVAFEGHSTLPITGTAVAKAPRVEVRATKIEIHDKIQFAYDTAVISRSSYDLMDEIVAAIEGAPQIAKIRIEGYASADGNPRHNQKLSAERARAVMTYLVAHGIAAGELEAVGYGAAHPIADNATPEGREQNRRVELTILDEANAQASSDDPVTITDDDDADRGTR